jgi:hypothetical protein
MAATLEKLTAKRVRLTLPLFEDEPDGDKVTVSYKPRAMTPKLERKFNKLMAEIRSESDDTESLVNARQVMQMFLLVVPEWDFRETEEGPTIPLTEEGLEDVPAQFLGYLLTEITKDQTPDPTTETPSSPSSGTTTSTPPILP